VQQRGGITIVDEIYLGLSFDATFGQTALALDDQVISINSFSKYFSMTGWRLGWLVVPEALVPVIERIAQNLFICPARWRSTPRWPASSPTAWPIRKRRRAEFKARRDLFRAGSWSRSGCRVPVMPDGAFYAWADCARRLCPAGFRDSWEFAFALLQHAHLAVTPGRDFGQADTARFVRFSSASSMDVDALNRPSSA
jgi:aspartate/methionine/tyrosine aminotransferase